MSAGDYIRAAVKRSEQVRRADCYDDLLAALREGVDRCAHEDGCRWWIANIGELNTPEQRAANDAKCNCIIGEMRAAIARAEGRT